MGGQRIKIGHIELLTELTTSVFGDTRLFFQHLRHRMDSKYYPDGWNKYDHKITDEDPGWGETVPDTWPTTEEEAKNKFMEQERLFGCPFAWLLGIHTEQDLVDAGY